MPELLGEEERIELVSDEVYLAAMPHVDHKTSVIDKAAAWPELEAIVCKFRLLGLPMREISQGYSFGLETVRDRVRFAQADALKEQTRG